MEVTVFNKSMGGGEERCIHGFGRGIEGKRPLGRLGSRWGIILRWIFRKWNGGMDWIDLALHKDRWRASVEAVMNLRVP